MWRSTVGLEGTADSNDRTAFRYGAYGSQSKLADQRPSPERPTLCPQIPLYSFVIAVETRLPDQ